MAQRRPSSGEKERAFAQEVLLQTLRAAFESECAAEHGLLLEVVRDELTSDRQAIDFANRHRDRGSAGPHPHPGR